ncbi:MAG: acetyl-CoA hydrolase [Puniceicoccales bacterium]|jgi:succinate CoA transferase|nr:acetyl-CoA hydrolase [Puniceicoccales bacterium]
MLVNFSTHDFPEVSAEEAASFIENGQTVAVGGFTAAGSVKLVTRSLAERALEMHRNGQEFRVRLLASASTDAAVDEVLAAAEAISYRVPYQGSRLLRQQINQHCVEFADMHLSHMVPLLKSGALGPIDFAIFEAAAISSDGRVLLTSGIGAIPTIARMARRIIVELNAYHPPDLEGLHDIYELDPPPRTREVPIYRTSDRIGSTLMQIDPARVVAVVRTDIPDNPPPLQPMDDISRKIGENIAQFLLSERLAGRIPEKFLPLQAGVGNVSNALMGTLCTDSAFPPFDMYSELLQDTIFDGIECGRVRFASSSGLAVSPAILRRIYDHLDEYHKKLVLRPMEISNHPEVIRRLGVIGINGALEVDLWGNVNSTHVSGTQLVNGIGGSGDFSRNCAISIFATPSTAKNGKISCIVPMCSHIDHTEHDTQIFVTEYGVADLRGLCPSRRAKTIIEKCAHPDYRPLLYDFLKYDKGHIPIDIQRAFSCCGLKESTSLNTIPCRSD